MEIFFVYTETEIKYKIAKIAKSGRIEKFNLKIRFITK
jgi:hypothetical protein